MLEKRYFVREGLGDDRVEKTLIIADTEDIIEKIELAGLVYVPKDSVEDIEEYRIESLESNESADLEDMQDYLFMTIEDFTSDEIYFLQNGYVELPDLEKFEDVDIDSLDEEEIKRLEEETEEELRQSIVKNMKINSITADMLETYKAWGYFNGSNWVEYPVENWYYGEWVEITDELEDMKALDYQEYNTGHKTLFELKDGRRVLIDTSYYQGSLWEIVFINEEVETVKDAEEWVRKENAKLNPYF